MGKIRNTSRASSTGRKLWRTQDGQLSSGMSCRIQSPRRRTRRKKETRRRTKRIRTRKGIRTRKKMKRKRKEEKKRRTKKKMKRKRMRRKSKPPSLQNPVLFLSASWFVNYFKVLSLRDISSQKPSVIPKLMANPQ